MNVSPAHFTPKSPRLGGKVDFEFVLTAKKAQTLQVDYRVHFVKANGKTGPKVFKLRRLELARGEAVRLHAAVSFAPMTTRKCYKGIHRFEALVNGVGFPLGSVRLQ